ncbi:FtsX-like permease family protein [Myxococcota bacterium]|nr:FtsX-like permease family protein [Myxococcota bacterium]
MLVRMAWRNILRNPRRTLVVTTAIAVGIAGCVLAMAVNIGMVTDMIHTTISNGLGHLQVHGPGWDERPELEVRIEGGREALAPELESLSGVQAWSTRVRSDGLVASPRASVGVAVIGVDPEREARVSEWSTSVVQGNWLEEPRQLVVGTELARRLQADLGSKVVVSVQDLQGNLTGRAYRLGGLLESDLGAIDDATVFMHIRDAQGLFEMGSSISEGVVTVIDDREIPAVQSELEARLGEAFEVRSWEQLEPVLVYMIEAFDSVAWVLYAAVYIAMSFGIANVLMMAVFERTREIGMMRAMGMGRVRVMGLILMEGVFVTGLGLLAGIGLALLGVWALRDGIDISAFAGSLDDYAIGTRLTPVLRWSDLWDPVIIGAITAVLSGIWPAWRASRAQPADALRHV